MVDFKQERALAKNRIRRRGIYLLPNLFTTAALFAGFYAIVQAMNGRFDQSAGCDLRRHGARRSRRPRRTPDQDAERVRRRVRQPLRHGFVWRGAGARRLRMVAAQHGQARAGSRRSFTSRARHCWLARFNTMLEVADKRYFQGLPSPSAAALVAGFVWIIDDYAIDPETVRWAAWAVTLFAGLTMVSNLKYYSFKTINLRRSVPFAVVILIVLFIVLISYQPSVIPLPASWCMRFPGLSGRGGWRVAHRRKSRYSESMSSLRDLLSRLSSIAIPGDLLLLLRPARR